VSEFLTEEEQVERLKQWWRENGRSIIVGVVIGLGIFGGWQGWKGYERQQAESGSAAYDRFLAEAQSGDLDVILQAESQLESDFANTAYADFSGFKAAGELVSAGRLDEAAQRLESIHEKGANTAIRNRAAMRLARVLMGQSRLDEAEQLLNAAAPAFAGEAARLRGDLARLRGDAQAARAAYQQALDAGADREWVELMLQQVAEETAG